MVVLNAFVKKKFVIHNLAFCTLSRNKTLRLGISYEIGEEMRRESERKKEILNMCRVLLYCVKSQPKCWEKTLWKYEIYRVFTYRIQQCWDGWFPPLCSRSHTCTCIRILCGVYFKNGPGRQTPQHGRLTPLGHYSTCAPYEPSPARSKAVYYRTGNSTNSGLVHRPTTYYL